MVFALFVLNPGNNDDEATAGTLILGQSHRYWCNQRKNTTATYTIGNSTMLPIKIWM